MEVEKMEVDSKAPSIKVEAIEREEPDVSIKPVKEEPHVEEDKSKEDAKNIPIVDEKNGTKREAETFIEIIPKEDDLAYLVADGLVIDDENITMTAEEVRSYIEKFVLDHIEKNNPLKEMNRNARHVYAKIKKTRDEFLKLYKLIDNVEREQLRCFKTKPFLRQMLTKTGGVAVDLPVLPNSLPLDKREEILRKGLENQPSKPTSANASKAPPPKDASNANSAQNPAGNIECIDLTDETEAPKPAVATATKSQTISYLSMVKHPAPLPPKPFVLPNKSLPPVPPKPRLKISAEERGIVLQWDMIPNHNNAMYAPLDNFDIFGYQEQKNVAINTLLWKKIGTVKAMTLPMACTLTQFLEGNTYHFSIRAVDKHGRCGSYSDPISIVYKQSKS